MKNFVFIYYNGWSNSLSRCWIWRTVESADFEEGDYVGDSFTSTGAVKNDTSSLKVQPGYIVTLFEGDNLDGYSGTFTEEIMIMQIIWQLVFIMMLLIL